jgi:hypothetical protein
MIAFLIICLLRFILQTSAPRQALLTALSIQILLPKKRLDNHHIVVSLRVPEKLKLQSQSEQILSNQKLVKDAGAPLLETSPSSFLLPVLLQTATTLCSSHRTGSIHGIGLHRVPLLIKPVPAQPL